MKHDIPTGLIAGAPAGGALRERAAVWRGWLDRNVLELGREMRLSYLPPLMVYLAAGVSGLTGIVGTFFVKEQLGVSAAFLAALAFWAGIPWALKMPIGHLVDLIWRWKGWLVFLGAALIAGSLLVMVGLVAHRPAMAAVMPAAAWYVLGALLAPVGYVIQDAVADAMTVEAVPRAEADGTPIDGERRKLMHTTMQTLGRVAIIGGSVLVALINLLVFAGAENLAEPEKLRLYERVYLIALAIPVLSVLGVVFAALLNVRDRRRLAASGVPAEQAGALLAEPRERPEPNWWILGGSLVFVAFTVATGLANLRFGEEIIFAGSLGIVGFLVARLTRELESDARETLLGTAIIIFVFRAVPGPGAAVQWWMIDVLGFDPQFFSVLSLTASFLTLAGMFVFRRFMAERSLTYVVGFLTLCGAVLALPQVGMYYGLHVWAARMTGGVIDARFIALVDTALESPLGQIAMIPMLAWIARSAPSNLKATYFAVMASFTNLALSLSQLGTKYLNEVFVVTRAVKDPATGAVTVPADYGQLGGLLLVQLALALALPFAAILLARALRLRSA
jgi:MFS family permease